jgi:hypothetical protein
MHMPTIAKHASAKIEPLVENIVSHEEDEEYARIITNAGHMAGAFRPENGPRMIAFLLMAVAQLAESVSELESRR